MKYSFGEDWKYEGKGELDIFGDKLLITKKEVALGRARFRTDDVSVGTFEFTFECETNGCANNVSAFAMVNLYKEDGSALTRMYADNENEYGTKKRCVVSITDEVAEIGIDLGLKGYGSVLWSEPEVNECEPVKPRLVKVAATHIRNQKTLEEKLKAITDVVDRAGRMGADLIILSEGMYDAPGSTLAERAATTDDFLCTFMKEKAKEYGAYIVVNFDENENGKYYNCSALIDRAGNLAGKYHKTHLAFSEWENGATPGDDFPVFDTDFGKLGMLICWDMYFPETARIMAQRGAELIAVSTQGDPAFRHVSRAMENGIYVAVSGAQYHNLNDCRVGSSKIIAPNGVILAQTSEHGDVAFAEIDLNNKTKINWLSIPATKSIPENIYNNEKRHELYGEI